MSIDESALRLGESLQGEIGFVSTCLGATEGVPTIYVFLRKNSSVTVPTEWEGFPVREVTATYPAPCLVPGVITKDEA